MSVPTLIFGNKNYSSWSLRPWILLKENNIKFVEKRVALFAETTDAELSGYHSDGKVPILQDGELVIWDSLAIMEYLSEKYLKGRGWPIDVRARAVARSVSAEMHSSFMHVRTEMPMNLRKTFQNHKLTSDALREVERIKFLWRMCRTEFGHGGEWLFGDYSIADAMYAPIVMRFLGYGVPLQGIEQAYTQRVMQQPAIREWIEAGKSEHEIIAEDEVAEAD